MADVQAIVRDRITELRRVRAGDLIPNEKNFRRHTDQQRAALRGVLSEVGYASALIAYDRDGELVLIDGHLRAEDNPEQEVPVLILDVTEAEADLLLTVLDPMAAMAVADNDALQLLLAGMENRNADLDALLGTMPDVGAALQALTAPENIIDHEITEEYYYQILVECDDEDNQGETLQKLEGMGYKCKLLTL